MIHQSINRNRVVDRATVSMMNLFMNGSDSIQKVDLHYGVMIYEARPDYSG